MGKEKDWTKKRATIDISEPAILVRINQKYREGLTQEELYKITRGEWVIGERRIKAKYAFAVYRGIVLQVYEINKWIPFSGQTPSNRKRWCFEGKVAEELQHYKDGSVKHYFARGEVNPVKNINC